MDECKNQLEEDEKLILVPVGGLFWNVGGVANFLPSHSFLLSSSSTIAGARAGPEDGTTAVVNRISKMLMPMTDEGRTTTAACKQRLSQTSNVETRALLPTNSIYPPRTI